MNHLQSEGLREGRDKGVREGLDKGIRGAIALLLDIGMKPGDIIERIAAQYDLSTDAAKTYYNEVINV